MSARALEFTILTASRTGEVRGATWAEIDLKSCVWTIAAERMTVRALPRDPRNPEDVDRSANDHALDATSYLIAGASQGRIETGTFAAPAPRMPDTGNRVIYV